MKKLFLILILLSIGIPSFAQDTLTMTYDENKKWQRYPSRPLPYNYDIIVSFEGVQHRVKALDRRKFETEEKALQEAKYKLNMEKRPAVECINGWTKEQTKAFEDFNSAINHYTNAKNLVDLGLVTAEQARLDEHKLKIKEKYLICINLGVDVWSPVP